MADTRKLEAVLEKYLSDEAERKTAFMALVSALRQAIKDEEIAPAASVLRRAITPALDYTCAQALHRLYTTLKKGGNVKPKVRLAVLGGFTTAQLITMMELYLFAAGVPAEIHEAEYGIFRQEILDADSTLYQFKPQMVFLATTWRDAGHRPNVAADQAELQRCVDAELAEWSALWSTANSRLGCQIILNNFDCPPWRQMSNHEMRHPGSLQRYLAELNRALADRSPSYVTIHDVDNLAACAGRWNWGDERFFHLAKLPCALECLVEYGHSVASLVLAIQGLSKKCLALDLDNTLWGGVIGDDGLGGIRLGQGSGEGESFLAFQRYVKSLKDRGVILAVCSKNETNVAKEVFEKHTEMVLRLDDIACFVANWDNKADNLRRIAKELNIGVNSLVLADDNPAERALVRQLAPEVAVPELPADPAGYIQAIERYRYFQVASIGKEDFQRTRYYQTNAKRQAEEQASGSVEDFLKSLNMVAKVGPVNDATLERTAQLINKSNQFNLTTRRRSAAEVRALAGDGAWITRTISLADRLGDNGLISVILAKADGDALVIDTWLMSCRVLKRGVEQLVLNHLVRCAESRGLKAILGEYIPTEKNVIVKNHYESLGFSPINVEGDGHGWWRLAIGDGWKPLPVFIEEKPS